MDRLKELLSQMGASTELVTEFTTALDEHVQAKDASIREEYEKKYVEKVDRAKRICVEEVGKEKVRLARRVQVFLESKQRDIEEAAQRQREIEESEATQNLRRVKSLLETGNPDAVGGVSTELQAARDKNARFEKVLASMKEELDAASSRATRAHKIAEDVLAVNHKVESYIKAKGLSEEKAAFLEGEWKKPWENKDDGGGEACGECGKSPCCCDGDNCESKQKTKKPVSESRKKKRLDSSRKAAAKPRSTRSAAISESRTKSDGVGDGDPDIASLAANMNELI